VRLPDETRKALDRWAAAQEDQPGRSEAIRRLVEQALAAAPKRGRTK
jgi:metal-responsive CopG/Arc/MetJ family transcriptional regulator